MLKEMCSLENCTELRKLIIENPELPLLIFWGEDVWDGEHQYTQGRCSEGEIKELTLYEDVWLDSEDYEEKLAEDLIDEFGDYLSDEEYDKMIAKKVAETEFIKAIVVYVG